jgi:putative addiction module component (TIGR02574 family)
MDEDKPDFFDELDLRVESYEAGETTASDWEEVAARLRQALEERKS